MARIAFMIDDEEGHLFPSFGLAYGLARAGYEIVYLSVADNEKYVREEGYAFYPIFERVYPKGHKKVFNQSRQNQLKGNQVSDPGHIWDHLEDLMRDDFNSFLKSLHADLFIVSGYLDIEALLLYYKFGIEPVIFSPGLWEPHSNLVQSCATSIIGDSELAVKLIGFIDSLKINIKTLEDFVNPLATFCELIACNKELDIREQPLPGAHVHYIGPSIRKSYGGNMHEGSIVPLPDNKKIIYASLGTQTVLYGPKCQLFFEKIIKVMQYDTMQDFHLVLALGSDPAEHRWPGTGTNVTMVKWISQTAVLKNACLAITHGGLGTIKECIYFGVPMIILPMGRDQPLNATRVQQCELGLTGNIDDITVEELYNKMHFICNSDLINSNIRKMQKAFRETESANVGVHVIENILKGARAAMR